MDDSDIYYEPSRVNHPINSLSETPFYIANPTIKKRNQYEIIVEDNDTRKNRVHHKITSRSNSERNHKITNVVHEINIEAEDLPLYLDIGILKIHNNNKRTSEQSGKDIIKLSESELVKCIDLHIVVFSRSNGMDKELVKIWDKTKFKRYEELTDLDLMNDIENNCRSTVNIVNVSLHEIKKSQPRKSDNILYSTYDFQEKNESIENSSTDERKYVNHKTKKEGNVNDSISFLDTVSTTELPNSENRTKYKFAERKNFEVRSNTHLTQDTIKITTASYDDLFNRFIEKDVDSLNEKQNVMNLLDNKKNKFGTELFYEIPSTDLIREAVSDTTEIAEDSTSKFFYNFPDNIGNTIRDIEENSDNLTSSLSNVWLTESPIKSVAKELDSGILNFIKNISDYEDTDQSVRTPEYEYSNNYTNMGNVAYSTIYPSDLNLSSALTRQSISINSITPFTTTSNTETVTEAPDLITRNYAFTIPVKIPDNKSNPKKQLFKQANKIENTEKNFSDKNSLKLIHGANNNPSNLSGQIASLSPFLPTFVSTTHYNNQDTTVKGGLLVTNMKQISDTTLGITTMVPSDITQKHNIISSNKKYDPHDNYAFNETNAYENAITHNNTHSTIGLQSSDHSTIDGPPKSTTVYTDTTLRSKITNSEDYHMQDNYNIDFKSSDHFTTESESIRNHTNYSNKNEERKGYPEIEMKISKIITKELENDTVISNVDGIETIPNNDFKEWANDTKPDEEAVTPTLSTATNTVEMLSTSSAQTNVGALSPRDIFGRLYFLFGEKRIPVRFVQDSEGQLKLGIDGGKLCSKIVDEKLNVSLILAAICKCALSENCANNLYEPS